MVILKGITLQIKNRVWVHPLFNKTNEFREYHQFFHALRRQPKKVFEYLRMSTDTFDSIVSKFHDSLEGERTNWRRPTDAEQRVVATIR
jgi:hypothetical protein